MASSGFVAILAVELHFPDAGSLKGKRKHVLSAKAQLQNRFGASVAEVDHHELWQRAALTAAFVARQASQAEDLAAQAERWLAGQEWELVSSRLDARLAGRPPRGGAVSNRMRRVDEAVREVVAEAVGELKDPRIGLVTVTGVRVSRDLREGTVYVVAHGSEKALNATLEGLASAHAILQARVARELRLKRTPLLSFEYDRSVEQGMRMTKLIDELAPEDASDDTGDQDQGDDDGD